MSAFGVPAKPAGASAADGVAGGGVGASAFPPALHLRSQMSGVTGKSAPWRGGDDVDARPVSIFSSCVPELSRLAFVACLGEGSSRNLSQVVLLDHILSLFAAGSFSFPGCAG